MAPGAWLTRLLGVCVQLALIANSQPLHHSDLPEDGNDAEFHSNSIGVSKAIDLKTRTIAYKDHILKLCYIEKISTQSAWDKDRLLIVHPMLLTTQQVDIIGGHIIANFCYGWPSKLLRLPSNIEIRRKRSNQQYYFVGRRPRGQTQSQYLQFGGDADSPGKAEAEATRQGSKATVYGSRGMGQAQSQSDPFSCADCFGGVPGSPSSESQSPALHFGRGSGGLGGRQYDASGQPIQGTGTRPGISQIGDFGRTPGNQHIGGLLGGGGGRGDGRVEDGRATGTTLPSQTGQGYIPGRGADEHRGAPGQLYSPDGRVVTTPGQSLVDSQLHPGATGLLPGTIAGRPGPANIGNAGTIGGPGTGIYLSPGHSAQVPGSQQTVGFPGYPGQAPGSFQTHPGQGTTLLPGSTVGGSSGGTDLRPGSLQVHPGQIGAPGTATYFGPGQTPDSHITHPGQTGRLHEDTTVGGPGSGTVLTPGYSGQVSGSPQTGTYPSQVGSTGSGDTGIDSTRPGALLYDNGGLQRPGGRPAHPGDVGSVTPGGVTTQPGQTTYYIPGGIRPRPSDGSFGYYPTTGIGTGRTQDTHGAHGSDAGGQEGTFNGQVAGQYRPASGPGGDFSGTFHGRYSPHDHSGTGRDIQSGGQYQGGQGPGTHGLQGTVGVGGQQSGQPQQGYPGFIPPGTISGPAGPSGQGNVEGQGGQGQWTQKPGQTQGGTGIRPGQGTGGVGRQESGQTQQGYPGFIPTGTISGSGGPSGQGNAEGQGGQEKWVQKPGQTQGGTGIGPGQSQIGATGTYVPGHGQIHSGNGAYPGQVVPPSGHPGQVATGPGQYPSSGGQPGYQQGTGSLLGQGPISGTQYPIGGSIQPGYPDSAASIPGQGQISGGHYPVGGSGQPVYQQGTGHVQTSGQYPVVSGGPGYQQGSAGGSSQQPVGGGGQPGYQQGAPGQSQLSGGQYPIGGSGKPGYQQGHIQPSGQYPVTGTGPVYQSGGGTSPGQLHSSVGGQYPIGGGEQTVYQQGTGLTPGHGTTGGQYPQPGYQPGGQIAPGSSTVSGTGQPNYGQQGGSQVGQGSYPGVGVQQGSGIYGQQQTGAGQGQFGPQSGQTLGGGSDGRGIYQGQGGTPGAGTGAPGALLAGGQAGQGAVDDDSDSQAQSTIQRADNETQASASSSGRFAGGTAQSQVSGSYAGTGSFSASAGTNDGLRGAQTQVTGNSEGTLSSSQGLGGRAKSQAQVQLAADTGDTTSNAQTGGHNHGTNTQVQSGIKGGMADAQANGPGATSSQAQIGFTPYDATTNEDDPINPHNGGGTASASSGTHAGKSQVQINGKYAFGIRYTGQAQASSANSGYTAENINLPTMKPIDFSQNTYGANKPARTQQEKVNVRQIEDQTILQIITSSTTQPPGSPEPDEDDSEYDDYDDPNPPAPPPRQNLIQQARVRSLMHDALDPLEDLDDHGMQLQGDLKHGDIIPPGKLIPGSPGYKIPLGFRGRVNEENTPPQRQSFNVNTDDYQNPRLVYAVGANANRRGYNNGFGSGYSYQPRYEPIQYGFKSSTPHQPKHFVSVTKSETGSHNIITGKKTPSVYYTQSSTCGYFTNTCVYSNGRKICLPKPKSNPDGTPIVCRN